MTEDARKALDALAEYAGKGRAGTDLEAVARVLATEADRGIIIILCAYIEDALFDRIVAELPQGTEHRAALKRNALRSLEDRLAMAQALDLITADEAFRIRAMWQMRNACAHSRSDLSFDTPELQEVMKHLPSEGQSFKESFVIIAGRLLHALVKRELGDGSLRKVYHESLTQNPGP